MPKEEYPFIREVQKGERVSLPSWLKKEFGIKEGALIELAFIRKIRDKKPTKKIIG